MKSQTVIHNNFGICGQVYVNSTQTIGGLSKVQASTVAPGNELIESEKAEIAVYDGLYSTSPSFESQLDRFLSKDQEG